MALAIILLSWSAVSSSAVQANDSCDRAMPRSVAAVRGYTFSGTVISIRAADPLHRHHRSLDPALGVPIYITLRLDQVYAQRQDARLRPAGTNPDGIVLRPGGTLRLYGESCDGIRGFSVGPQYLVSVGTLTLPSGPVSAAWQLHRDQASLVRMYPPDPSGLLGARQLAAARTLRAAVALVAPDANLPPTSTLGVTATPPDTPIGTSMLALVALVGFWLGRRIRRRAASPS